MLERQGDIVALSLLKESNLASILILAWRDPFCTLDFQNCLIRVFVLGHQVCTNLLKEQREINLSLGIHTAVKFQK